MTTPVVRLGTPGEIAATIPYLIGFQPQNSLVIVSLRERRVGLTLRYDLPAWDLTGEMVADVQQRLAHDGATGALVLVFTDEEGTLPRLEQVQNLELGLMASNGVTVREALLVRDGLWSSYLCESTCCPVEGTPIPTDSNNVDMIATANADRPVLNDRDALSRSVAGPDTDDGLYDATNVDLDGLALWKRALAERMERPTPLTPQAAATLAVQLTDVQVRDRVLTLALESDLHLDHLLALVIETAQNTHDRHAAPICTVLAVLAWLKGDGGLANVALDRAFAATPNYSLATLIRTGLDAQLPPKAVRAWLTETASTLNAA